MKKSAKEILKGIRDRYKEMEDHNMRIVNADRLYAEVARCIQPIKDKQANIHKLNTKRGNHGHCREGFPLQYEEISDFCGHIQKGLSKLESVFFDLKYFSPAHLKSLIDKWESARSKYSLYVDQKNA